MRETHISWVLLAGDRAYKLKKPLRLPFLDYGTLERRREMCREEVRLNRRLAPRRLPRRAAVVPAADGRPRSRPQHDPRRIEYAVEMRRFDEARTLAARVPHGGARYPALVAVGRRLAAFHAAARRATAPHATAALTHALDENFATLLELAPTGLRAPGRGARAASRGRS